MENSAYAKVEESFKQECEPQIQRKWGKDRPCKSKREMKTHNFNVISAWIERQSQASRLSNEETKT